MAPVATSSAASSSALSPSHPSAPTQRPPPGPFRTTTSGTIKMDDDDHEEGHDGDGDGEAEDDEDDEFAYSAGETHEMVTEQTVKAGYLWKKGEKRKTWKKRWFVLRSSKLCYYKNDKEYQLLRFIDMSDVHTIAAIELKRQDNTFGIVTSKRTYYVKAATSSESHDWIRALNEVKVQMSHRNSMSQGMHDMDISAASPPAAQTQSPPRAARPTSMTQRDNSQISERGTSQASASRAAAAAAAATSRSGPAVSITIPGSGQYSSPAEPRAIAGSENSAFSPLTATTDSDTGAEAYGLSYASSNLGSSPGQDVGSQLQHHYQSGSDHSDGGKSPQPQRGVGGRRRAGSTRRDTSAGSQAGDASSSGAGAIPSSYQSSAAAVMSSSDEDEPNDEEELDQAMPLPMLPGSNSNPQAVSFAESTGSPAPQGAGPSSAPSQTQVLSDPHRVIIQSYLMKQSNRRKQWRKRWFVLTSSKLMYTRSHMDARAHRQIPLTSILDAIEHASKRPSSPTGGGGLASPGPGGSFNFSALGEGGAGGRAEEGEGEPRSEQRRQSVVAAAAGVASNIGAGVGLAERESNKKKMDNCFKIITPKRTFLLCATSEEEEIKWLSALQALLLRTRGKPIGSAAPDTVDGGAGEVGASSGLASPSVAASSSGFATPSPQHQRPRSGHYSSPGGMAGNAGTAPNSGGEAHLADSPLPPAAGASQSTASPKR